MTNPDLDESDCTADQWFTSAAAAMFFAGENWQAFCEFMADKMPGGVPIDAFTMLHHAGHVIALSDPERMPS